jgi:hypothetical protein
LKGLVYAQLEGSFMPNLKGLLYAQLEGSF